MVVAVLKCQMCGKQFEAEMLDRDDPNSTTGKGLPYAARVARAQRSRCFA